MRIAIVSDIHGNRTAFEAVLADLRQTVSRLDSARRRSGGRRFKSAWRLWTGSAILDGRGWLAIRMKCFSGPSR